MAKKTAEGKKASTTKQQGDSFEESVRQVLSLMGYSVRQNILLSGTQIDLVAEKASRLENIRLLVECTDRTEPVGVPLVKEKSATLLSVPTDGFIYKLLFVSRAGFTAEAKAFADENPRLDVMGFAELEAMLIDFEPYARWYFESYEQSSGIFAEARLADRYVELNGTNERNDRTERLSITTRNWLRHPNNNLLILLGEFGTGKTSFCRHFAYELLDERYRRKQDQPYVPILINLRDNKRTFDIQSVLADTMVNRYGLQLPSFMAFEHFCAKRHVCLLLDGLDEMIDRSDRQALIDCWSQVFLLASLNAKIIVTCRTNFFNSNADLISILKGFSLQIESTSTKRDVLEIDYGKHGQLVFVSKLTESQIRAFVEKRFDDADSILQSIQSIHDLTDLCKRPVLLDMILTTLPQLSEKKEVINSAALYGHYTDRWSNRDDWRVSLPLELRQGFSETLAWAMHSSGIEQVGFAELENALTKALTDLADSSDELEKFKHDIKTCSYLVRFGQDDTFRFAHKSFLEFFVARVLVRRLTAKEAIEMTTFDDLRKTSPKPSEDPERESDTLRYHGMLIGSGKSSFLHIYWADIVRSFETKYHDQIVSVARKPISDRVSPMLAGASLEQHLSMQIASVFQQREPGKASREIRLTEEIATFAAELFANSDVTLSDVLVEDITPENQDILCDILRLSKSVQFAADNIDVIRARIDQVDEEPLRVSLCAALARSAPAIEFEFMSGLRERMQSAAWSYVLFEIAKRGQDLSDLLTRISGVEDLGTLDKVICHHGLHNSLPDDEQDFLSAEMVLHLLRSDDTEEAMFGLSLCHSVLADDKELLSALRYLYERFEKIEDKESVVDELRNLRGEQAWRGIRMMGAKETNRRLRATLRRAEEAVRNADNTDRTRSSWNASRTKNRIRDSLWHSVKRHRRKS